jgi:hypothetical protein
MTNADIELRETTNTPLSGHFVGVGNIWARDLPDDEGVVSSRMSATLAIFDPASQQLRHEEVFAGNVVSLGADRYRVVRVEASGSAPGAITLRKLPS